MFRNLYHIFDLPDFFEDDYELRRLYRILGSRWHPSRNVNMSRLAERRFSELSRAFEILADKERRNRYNQLLKDAQQEDEFTDVLQPFFNNRGFDYYDNVFKKMLKEEDKLFNDDFFKETDDQFKKLMGDKESKDKKEKTNEVDKKPSSPKGYYKSIQTNNFIKDGQRYTKTTKSWEDSEGNKNVETIENHGDGKVIKNIEKIYHDEHGNLIREMKADEGNGEILKEKKLLSLNNGKQIEAMKKKEEIEDKDDDITIQEERDDTNSKMQIEK